MEKQKRPEGMAVWLAYPDIMKRRNVIYAQENGQMQDFWIEVFRDQPGANLTRIRALVTGRR